MRILHGIGQRRSGVLGADILAWFGRFRQLGYESAKFAMIGVTGVFITNGVWSYRRFVWVTSGKGG